MKQKHQEDLSQLLYDGALLKVLISPADCRSFADYQRLGGVLKCFFFRLKIDVDYFTANDRTYNEVCF
jgi:hypothetical protein